MSHSHIGFQRRWEVPISAHFQLGQCHGIITAISEIPLRPEDRLKLLSVALNKGAQSTTAIEGNTLSDQEIDLIADGRKLPPSKAYQEIEVRNILRAMNTLLHEVVEQNRSDSITPEFILRCHEMIGRDLGAALDAIPGQFRQDNRIVGTYRCPPPGDVPILIERLCTWINDEFGDRSDGQTFGDAVLEAIVTHAYIAWIHPFGDGNGRTARLLEFFILLRAGNPDIASHILSNHYNVTRPMYYKQLDQAGKTGDLSGFIAYAIMGFRDGLLETLRTVQRSQFHTAWRSYIYDRFADRKYRKTVFKRRRSLILEMPLARTMTVDDISICTPDIARTYATVSPQTLMRDLEILIEMELIRKAKEGYIVNSDMLKLDLPGKRHHGN